MGRLCSKLAVSVLTLVSTLSVSPGQDGSARGGLDLRPAGDFVVKGSMPDIQSSSRLFTVQDQMAKNRDMRRPDGGGRRLSTKVPTDLVYVLPGGLDSASGYDFSFSSQLGSRYKPGSFSFSGWAGALVFIYGVGWGTENANGDFTPYLVSSSYQQVDEPCYEFMWANTDSTVRRTGQQSMTGAYDPAAPAGQDNIRLSGTSSGESQVTGAGTPIGGSIYLNYVFRVPKNNYVKWADDLAMTRFTFAGGFANNAPKIQGDSVFVCSPKGVFKSYGADLKRPAAKLDWRLPDEMRSVTSFAVGGPARQIFAADDGGRIFAFDSQGGALWSADGTGPLLVHRDWLFGLSSDYRSIQVLEKSTGRAVGSFELPRFLPRDDNSFSVAGFSDGTFLFVQIPRQNRILCYKIQPR